MSKSLLMDYVLVPKGLTKIIPISSGGTQEQKFLGEKNAMSFHMYLNKEFLQQNFLVWYRYRFLKLIWKTCLKSMVIDSTRDLQS